MRVNCATELVTQISGPKTYTAPSGLTTVVAGESYVTSTSMSSECPITYTLWNSDTNAQLTTDPWVNINPSTGEIQVDGDTLGNMNLKVKYSYNGGTDVDMNPW